MEILKFMIEQHPAWTFWFSLLPIILLAIWCDKVGK